MNRRNRIWKWRTSNGFAFQAMTYWGDFGLKLIVKRYSLDDFDQAAPPGTHQSIYDSAIVPGTEEDVLKRLGWTPENEI